MIVPPDSCNYRHSLPSLHSEGERGGTRSSFSRAASLLQCTLSATGSAQGGKNVGLGVTSSKEGLGRDAGWKESSPASVHLRGQDRGLSRGSTGMNSRSKHSLGRKPSWWPWIIPRWGTGEGRITAGHFFPTPEAGSAVCGMFPRLLSTAVPAATVATQLPGNLRAGHQRMQRILPGEMERKMRDIHSLAETGQ